jgi:hypothetical protein
MTTSKDRTRQKLVGSMRKTKSAAAIGTDNVETEATAASPMEAEPARPRAGRGRAATTSQPKPVSADAYQSGRRVWPD